MSNLDDRNPRIGLVDDDDLVRFATKALLTCHNFEVDDFESAESLLELETMRDLDCFLIDYRMEGISGLQLLRHLRERTPDIPTIVASGYLSESEIEALRDAGAAAIMDKPIKSSELITELLRLTSGCV